VRERFRCEWVGSGRVAMNDRAVNVAILLLLVLELASGLGSFPIGEPDGRWTFWHLATRHSSATCAWCWLQGVRETIMVGLNMDEGERLS